MERESRSDTGQIVEPVSMGGRTTVVKNIIECEFPVQSRTDKGAARGPQFSTEYHIGKTKKIGSTTRQSPNKLKVKKRRGLEGTLLLNKISWKNGMVDIGSVMNLKFNHFRSLGKTEAAHKN